MVHSILKNLFFQENSKILSSLNSEESLHLYLLLLNQLHLINSVYHFRHSKHEIHIALNSVIVKHGNGFDQHSQYFLCTN